MLIVEGLRESILGLLGIGALPLTWKASYFGGLYDPWSPGGGDVRKVVDPMVSAAGIRNYLLSSPFGGDGWIVRVDNLEDVVGGHLVVGFGCIFGGILVALHGVAKRIYRIHWPTILCVLRLVTLSSEARR